MSTSTVYWSSRNPGEPVGNWNLIFDDPDPVIHSYNHYSDDRKKSLKRCPAFTDKIKNSFIIRSPFDLGINIVNGNAEDIYRTFGIRLSSHNGNESNSLLSIDMSYFFFSEDDIEMSLQAPFFNKADHLQYGAIVPGRYNISKWFRPINLEFNVWENSGKFEVKKGEPLAYINFNTKNKVVLKRFNLSNEAYRIATVCSNSSSWEPNIPIIERYSRFMRTKTNRTIIKEIKNNLME